MVDLLMNKMGNLMDEKLSKQEKRAQRKLGHLQSQIGTVADATQDGLNHLQKAHDETKNDIKVLQEAILTNAAKETPTIRIKEDDEDDKKFLSIAHGFKDDTSEEDIINTINKFLETNNLKNNVVEVFTYSDPARSGVIRFNSENNKKHFYRKLRGCTGLQIEENRNMKFSNKLTLKERAIEERLGQIKYRYSLKDDIDKTKIQIYWKQAEVKYKGKRIFWIEKDGQMKYSAEIDDIKTEVEECMKTFFQDRGAEESD